MTSSAIRETISVATMTRATEESAAQLLESLRNLSQAGLGVAVTDGGSPASFIAALRQLPGFDVLVVENATLCEQIAASLERATIQSRLIFYTEPDKTLFFTEHLESFLSRALSQPAAALTVAGRTGAAFETFPETQRLTEQTLNALCGRTTGVRMDYCYGPFLADRTLITRATIPADLGWGWRTSMFALAGRLGSSLAGVSGEYVCPMSDRIETDDDRFHRMRQLAQNVMGLLHGARA